MNELFNVKDKVVVITGGAGINNNFVLYVK